MKCAKEVCMVEGGIFTNGSIASTISPTVLSAFSLVISSSEIFLLSTKFRSFSKAIS